MSDSCNQSLLEHPAYLAVVNEKALLTERIRSLERGYQSLQEELKELKRTNEVYRRHLFGKKSEKIKVEETPAGQEKLFPTDLNQRPPVEKPQEVEVKSHKRKRRKSYKDKDGNPTEFPPELPREEVVLEPEDAGKCTSCGKAKVKISQKVTEKLCEVPAKFYVKRFIRPVYGCNCGRCAPVNVPAPYGVLPKSYLDESFIGSMIVKKYAWHLPFYRQSRMLRELGINISRDVLIYTAIRVGDLLSLIVLEMLKSIKSKELVQMDESPVVVAIREGNKKAKYSKAYFWPILAEKEVVFIYSPNRNHSNVPDILGDDFKGVLLSDGYGAYKSYCKSHPETSLALCWDHARRKFYEIKDEEPLAIEALQQIKELYRVEREIKELLANNGIQPDKIPKYRKAHALPILNGFKTWLETVRDAPEVLPKSNLMDACSYVLNHWDGLGVYLNHGQVPISNIAVEQQIRNLKLGAKNWLFAASEAGAQSVAVFNSLICTCKMNGINCLEYFTDVLRRLDTDTAKDLTPLAWMKARQRKITNENSA